VHRPPAAPPARRGPARARFATIEGNLIGRTGPRFVNGATALCAAIEAMR
jgi:hypothetical protein